MPAIKLRGRPEDRLLAGVLPGGIERRRRLAAEYISTGGIDVGEIRPKRTTEAIVHPVRSGDQEDDTEQRGGQHGECHQSHPFAGKPGAGAQKLNETGHRGGFSSAGLKESCRTETSTGLMNASGFCGLLSCFCPITTLNRCP